MELGYESTNSVQNLQSIFVMLTLYFFKLAVVLVMINVPVFYMLKESQYFSLAGLKYEV